MKACELTLLHEAERTVGPDFSCCLPFGGQLLSRAGVLTYSAPATVPPDGVYNAITIKGGCIVGVGTEDLSAYNVATCTAVPTPCGEGVSNVVSGIALQGGSGISVIGTGTTANPFVISATGVASSGSDGGGAIYLQAANSGVLVGGSGSASDPFTVAHKEAGDFDLINGMRFDSYGHLVQYSPASSTIGVNDVVAGYGIDVTRDQATKIVTVGLQKPANPVNATLEFGKYLVTLDEYNRIHKITENTAASSQGLHPVAYVRNCYRRDAETVTVLLGEASYLKIEFDVSGDLPTSSATPTTGDAASGSGSTVETGAPGISVDNHAITPTIVNPYRYVYFPNALYAAGTHTVTVSPNEYGLLTITAVWVG